MKHFYRLLLRLYPRSFRDEYGGEMTASFQARWAQERGGWLLLATILDTVFTASGVHAEILWQDLRYGLRGLLKDSSFTLASAATLALGIGATTAMFSLLHAALLRPLPFHEPDRIVRLFDTNTALRIEEFASSIPNLVSLQERSRSFQALAGFQFFDLNLTDGNNAERVQGLAVLGPFWEAAGIRPILGRTFLPEENRAGRENVVILSEGLWVRRFQRDPAILGKAIVVDGRSKTVIGIAPDDLGIGAAVDLVGPFAVEPTESRGNRQLDVIGRLQRGMSIPQAAQELNQIAGQLEREFPVTNHGWRVKLTPVRDSIVAPEQQRSLYVLLGAVGLLLTVACLNVANLLIARGTARHRELATRLAVGASKSRIVRQLVTESVLLGAMGGLAGVVLSWLAVESLAPQLPTYLTKVEVNGQVLAFALLLTFATSLLFGLGPALSGIHGDQRAFLTIAVRGPGASPGRIRQLLAGFQVGLATILVAGALLLTVSLSRMMRQDFGFRADHVVTARFSPPPQKFSSATQWGHYVDTILAEMRSLPGVRSAGITSEIPFGPVDTQQTVIAEERSAAMRTEGIQASWRLVTSGYLAALGVPLVQGRLWFDQEDFAQRPILISQDLARRLWPEGENPIGRRVRMSNTQTYLVIGVVGNLRQRALTERTPTSTIYWPAAFLNWPTMTIVLRTQGEPAGMASAMREAMRRADPMQPLFEITTMEEFVSKTASTSRLPALLLSLFAALALLLAAVGIAGLTAYSVARRRPELAIRLALGATSARIVREVALAQFRLCAAGVTGGLAAAWWLRPLVASLLFDVEPGYPPTYAGAGMLLLSAGLIAAWLPAMRITRIQPASALRSE